MKKGSGSNTANSMCCVRGVTGGLVSRGWLALVLLAVVASKTHAASYTWTGNGFNSDWDNLALIVGVPRYLNWGFATSLPDSDDNVVFGSGFASGNPDLNGARTVGSLKIDTTESRTIYGDELTLLNGSVDRTSGSSERQEIWTDVNLPFNPIIPISIWNIRGSGELALTGQLRGSSLLLMKLGSGTLSLESYTSNTYTGSIAVRDGTLRIAMEEDDLAFWGDLGIGDGTGAAKSAKVEMLGEDNLQYTTDVSMAADGWLEMSNGDGENIDSLNGEGVVNLGGLSVGNNDGSGTYSGRLLGPSDTTSSGGSFYKNGSGTQVLAGSMSNTHSFTAVSSGTLELAKDSGVDAMGGNIRVGLGTGAPESAVLNQTRNHNIPDTSDVEVRSDGRWNAMTETVQTITGSDGLINLLGDLTVGADEFTTTTYSGQIQGDGSFTKIGKNTQTLDGSQPNTYTGSTNINHGRLFLSKSSGVHAVSNDVQVGDGVGPAGSAILLHGSYENMPDNSRVNISSDGLWDLQGGPFGPRSETIGRLDGDEGAVIILGDLVVNKFFFDGVYSGTLEGSGTFTKTGSGWQTLSGSMPNTFSGLTKISNGSLILSKNDDVHTVSPDIQIGDGVGGVESASLSQTNHNNLWDSSDISLRVDGFWNTKTETVDEISGSGVIHVSTNLTVGADGGTASYWGKLRGFGAFTKIGEGTQTLSGSVSNTHTGLTWVRSGTLRLSKSPGFVALAGQLQVGDDVGPAQSAKLEQRTTENLPSGADVTIRSDGFWTMINGTTQLTESINGLSGTGQVQLGNLTVGESGGGGTYSGVLTGPGTFTKIGNGTQTLSGSTSNTYTGLTQVAQGTLELSKPSGTNTMGGNVQVGDGIGLTGSAMLIQTNSENIPDSSDVDVLADGLWNVNTETIDALDGDPGAVVNLGHLTVGAEGGSGTYAGVFTGHGTLTKIGSGTQTLSGASVNGWTTKVSGGTLVVANTTGSATGSGPVIVQSGGTLAGGGSVNGPVTVEAGGVFSPGTSFGVFNINSGLTLEAGSTLEVEVQEPSGVPAGVSVAGTDFDQVAITGSVSLAGELLLSALPDAGTFDAVLGTLYPVMTFSDRGETLFDTVTGTMIGTDLGLAVLHGDTDVTLRVSIPGDLNFDNKVSLADLSTFALNFGTTPGLYNETDDINSWQLGDFNSDGQITVADLSLLALNFGFNAADPTTPLSLHDAATLAGIDLSEGTLPGALTAVPEPAALTLLLTALPACWSRSYSYRV